MTPNDLQGRPLSSAHTGLLDRHRAVMPSWLALYYEEPIELVRGEGRRVWDANGKEYLDFFGGILTTMTAHALPEVVKAVQEQAARIMHASTLYLIRSQVELAEEIARLVPIPDAKIFFTTSGTEANETALLLASTARRSNQVLALRNSYHGRSFAAMAITGNRGWSASSLSPFNVNYVHGGSRYRSPFRDLDDEAFIERCVDDLRDVLATATAGDVACMIAEPIQGVGGFTMPPDGLFSAMKEVLDEYGILFISDEVQTGWGRTGDHFWGIEAHQLTPDIITFAKGLGNGLTIAGLAARPALMDGLTANSLSTFGGNPLSTTGALANLRYLLEHDLQGNARRIGEHLLRELVNRIARWPGVGDVRGRGLMIGIEFVVPDTTEPDARRASAVVEACKQRGLLIGRGGLYSNAVRIAPPLTVTQDEADEALERLDDAITATL